jgi:hypothetical protein
VKDVSSGDNYIRLVTPKQQGAIKKVTTASYTINPATDFTVMADTGTSNIVLPTSGLVDGMEFTVKNLIATPVTVDGVADATTNPTLAQWDAITVRYLAGSWYIVSRT